MAIKFHKKQIEVLNYHKSNDFFMLINSGAKRTGKTVLNNYIFLKELNRVKLIATKIGINEPQYILAGATLGSLYRNVLMELTNMFGLEFHMDKWNRFKLLGVQVCCFGHSKINDLGRIRGMTAFGAYINEGTMANEEVFNEIKSRCSGEGARILVDTNPDQPEHWLKVNYIDKSDGKIIQTFHYKLDDNTFLTDRYKDNIKAATPTGMFYDRDIEGLWVSAEGIVYKDFRKEKHYIKSKDLKDINFIKYFAGVDWGYEHPGAIVVLGKDYKGDIYLLEEHSKQHEEIEYWVNIAKEIKSRYGNISFYCDTARPEYIKRFKKENIKAKNGDKAVLAGIGEVARLIKLEKLKIVEDKVDLFKKEIFMYAWNKTTGEPVKVWDDVLDALRYAIYTESTSKKIGVSSKTKLGLR